MRRWALAAALCAVIIGWAAYDLWWPRRGDLRLFDPPEVARLETSMWRAYYDREFLGLYNDLAKLVRQQYRMPWLRSQVTAWHAARAAFLFERGKARADYERALPGLRSFYGAIRRTSVTGFDADRAARSELEWWIAHRARSGELERWLAEVQSCIYGLPAAAFAAHAKSRAEAMRLRDAAAATGRVTDREWARIEALLQDSWAALKTAVAAPPDWGPVGGRSIGGRRFRPAPAGWRRPPARKIAYNGRIGPKQRGLAALCCQGSGGIPIAFGGMAVTGIYHTRGVALRVCSSSLPFAPCA